MAAGIYLCLRNIVDVLGAEHSRISPVLYTRIFIPCDVVSLVLQAMGGGMASMASHQGRSSALGDHIMVAGLALQVVTLMLFMVSSRHILSFLILIGTQAVCIDFGVRTFKHPRNTDDTKLTSMRSSKRFSRFIVSLAIATICIFIRSVYRVAELSEGWTGHLIRQQWLFVGLEGVMVVVAVAVLAVSHPAFCFDLGSALANDEEVSGASTPKLEDKGMPAEGVL